METDDKAPFRIFSERLASIVSRLRDGFFRFLQRDFTLRDLALLFVFGFLLGTAFKTAAYDRLTIGFEDYRLSRPATLVDFNRVQERVLQDGGTLAVSPSPSAAPLCTDEKP